MHLVVLTLHHTLHSHKFIVLFPRSLLFNSKSMSSFNCIGGMLNVNCRSNCIYIHHALRPLHPHTFPIYFSWTIVILGFCSPWLYTMLGCGIVARTSIRLITTHAINLPSVGFFYLKVVLIIHECPNFVNMQDFKASHRVCWMHQICMLDHIAPCILTVDDVCLDFENAQHGHWFNVMSCLNQWPFV
jgi:hypothetical protein